jgi:PRTRC genetic system protein A
MDDNIDLGSVSAEEDFAPFLNEDEFADEAANANDAEAVEQPQAEQQTPKPETTAASTTNPGKVETGQPENPIEALINEAETKTAEKSRQSLYEKPPVFEYAGATENIEDSSQTFEELRIAKAKDFPELEDGKRVSWTIEYGKITKPVTDAKGTSIAKMKSDIETSKAFLDALKKSKDKNPVCKVKPKVTAQSKGTSSYKGVFVNIDDAAASGKLITLFPDKRGKVFEMRNTEMGRFVTPAASDDIMREVKAGFIPALPLIPLKHLRDIIEFFKMMAKDGNNEALANIYWDKQDEVFITDIPQQSVSAFSVKGEKNPAYDNDRYIHYMDIHSHNTMRAFFSATDDADEKATRVYAVVGNVLSFFPEIKVRISNGGKFMEIEPGIVFEGFVTASKRARFWFGQFQYQLNVYANIMSKVLGCGRCNENPEKKGDSEI